MTNEFAIRILKQYKEKPTLANEIDTVEEATWLLEALEMGIKALEQEPILDKIRAEIVRLKDYDKQYAYKRILEVIDKYKVESED